MMTNREMRLARVFAVVLMLFAVAEYWWAAKRPGWRVEWFGYVRGALSARQAWSNYRTEC